MDIPTFSNETFFRPTWIIVRKDKFLSEVEQYFIELLRKKIRIAVAPIVIILLLDISFLKNRMGKISTSWMFISNFDDTISSDYNKY